MTAKDCIRMLREIKDVAFATVDDKGQPQPVDPGFEPFAAASGADEVADLAGGAVGQEHA